MAIDVLASPSAASTQVVPNGGKIRRDSYLQKPSAGQRPEEEEARTRNDGLRELRVEENIYLAFLFLS